MGGRLPPFLVSVDSLIEITDEDGSKHSPKVEPILERLRK
jgi:hypothetical protein